MKLDSESPYHHSPPHEYNRKVIMSNTNPFIVAKDDHFMIDMLEIGETAPLEGKQGLASPIENKSAKVTSLPRYHLNSDDSFDSSETDDENQEVPHSTPVGFEVIVREDFYTDKSITKAGVTETKVCLENDQYRIDKEISTCKWVQSSDDGSVNEEVGPNQILGYGNNDSSSRMASSSASDNLNYKACSNPFITDDGGRSDLAFVGSSANGFKLDVAASSVSNSSAKITATPADHASVSGKDFDKDASLFLSYSDGNQDKTEPAKNYISSDFAESPASPASDDHDACIRDVLSVKAINSEGDHDISESVASSTPTQVNETTSIPASCLHYECFGKDSSSSVESGVYKPGSAESFKSDTQAEFKQTQLPSSQEITMDSHLVFSGGQKQYVDGVTYKNLLEQRNSAPSRLSTPFEVEPSAVDSGSKEISASYKAPSGVITFSFEKDSATKSSSDENIETKENQQSEGLKSDPGAGTGPIGAAVASRCSFRHLMQQGESDISASDLLSGPIAHSGHIPYSGSISMRSDSSTTSARSFAFPILQSEWNSSPVKMAKADRRRWRKHRGWKSGLLCCRF